MAPKVSIEMTSPTPPNGTPIEVLLDQVSACLVEKLTCEQLFHLKHARDQGAVFREHRSLIPRDLLAELDRRAEEVARAVHGGYLSDDERVRVLETTVHFDATEEEESTSRGSLTEVTVFQTFVLKRWRADLPVETRLPISVVLDRLRFLHDVHEVPGVLPVGPGPDPDSWVELRAPGRSLQDLGPSLSRDEQVHIFRETMAFGRETLRHGFAFNRQNPENTFFDPDSGVVSQIDLHHRDRDRRRDPRYRFAPAHFFVEEYPRLRYRVCQMLLRATWGRCLTLLDGNPEAAVARALPDYPY